MRLLLILLLLCSCRPERELRKEQTFVDTLTCTDTFWVALPDSMKFDSIVIEFVEPNAVDSDGCTGPIMFYTPPITHDALIWPTETMVEPLMPNGQTAREWWESMLKEMELKERLKKWC